MKVTMIVGEPAVGKSQLIKTLMNRIDGWQFIKIPYVVAHFAKKEKLVVIGDYSDPTQKFPGTDRLSMACQPRVIGWLWKVMESTAANSVIFEGDRLGNITMIEALRSNSKVDLKVVFISADQSVLILRREAERATQNTQFVEGRRTKIANIRRFVANHNIPHISFDCNTLEQRLEIVQWLEENRL